jgi:dTDP-4-amino-4,6-dideoxy-D-galactose acyltransferase
MTGAKAQDASSLCSLLVWDTNFFGFPIGRVIPSLLSAGDAERVSEWCQRESIRCLYFLCDSADDSSSMVAERAGFHLVDVRLDFSRKFEHERKPAPLTAGLTIRQWDEADLPSLEMIAAKAYGDTRFWHDQNFPRERVTDLYRQWIVNSCRGFADMVLVAEHDGQPAGFITCTSESEGGGRIGLVGVKSDLQGKGIGRALVEAATEYAVTQRWTRLNVATQARNISAQRLYQSQGFTTSSMSLWYHLWR